MSKEIKRRYVERETMGGCNQADGVDRLLLNQKTGALIVSRAGETEMWNASNQHRFELLLEPAIGFGATQVTQQSWS